MAIGFITTSCVIAGSRRICSSAPRPRCGAFDRRSRALANDEDAPAVQRLFDEVFARFDRLDSMMSVWRQGSDILRLNEAAGEHPVQVAPEVFEALTIARRISEWTDGK